MEKILVILGPTATGKSKLALKLAKKFNGELLSFDSRQVYKGMDIGTGKDTQKAIFKDDYYFLDGVKIWLYDLVLPNQKFNVADYLKQAKKILDDVCKRGKLPILVGGTGFYLQALIKGFSTLGIKPDYNLREKIVSYSLIELQDFLKSKDLTRFEQMNASDRLNPRRLVRAIEVAVSKKGKKSGNEFKADFLMIGLKAPFDFLYQKIDQRVENRIAQDLEKEIKLLLDKGYGFNNSALGSTLGYKQWQSYFKNQEDKVGVIQRWKYDEHAYARRQMTWFKKDKNIVWFDISKKGWETKVVDQVFFWYTGKNAKKNRNFS